MATQISISRAEILQRGPDECCRNEVEVCPSLPLMEEYMECEDTPPVQHR